MNTERRAYIYALINPIDNSVFYIGCTVNPPARLISHIYSINYSNFATTNLVGMRKKLIKNIIGLDMRIEMEILDKCVISSAPFWEEFYIGLFKSYGFILLQGGNPYSQKYLPQERCKHFVPLDFI